MFAIKHQRHIVNGLERHPAYKAAKPSIDCRTRAKIGWQHAPAATAARHVADGIQHFTKIDADFAPTLRQLGPQRLDPLFVGQIIWISLDVLLKEVGVCVLNDKGAVTFEGNAAADPPF